MTVLFKCKICGGEIEFEDGATIGFCTCCNTKQTLPKLDSERRANLYDRANHFRRNNDFDKASWIYEQILNEDTSDAEAYWSLVLCRYGIEYVEDPITKRRVPTVNRTQFTSIFDDDNYISALKYADNLQRSIYEEEAHAINEIQKGILAISQKEEPFDVFICYKETDENGRRTQDSVLANDLYHQLTQEGFKVFFSRITLEDKLGTAYEPYIFAALNSAKVMVVLGTRAEYFNAVWVKNEWGRFLSIVKQSGGKKVLIPAYRDMDPYDMPEEFSHLQAQDMSKLGFMQDLIRGIKKIVHTDSAVRKTENDAGKDGSAEIAPLIKRVYYFLEDGNFEEAKKYSDRVLDREPENVQGYLGKLLAEMKVPSKENLIDCSLPLDSNSNYKRILLYGGKELSDELEKYNRAIKERNESNRVQNLYIEAERIMSGARKAEDCKKAAEIFQSIENYRNAKELSLLCYEKEKEFIHNSAIRIINDAKQESDIDEAISLLQRIKGYKNADSLLQQCPTWRKSVGNCNEIYVEGMKEFESGLMFLKKCKTDSGEINDATEAIRHFTAAQDVLSRLPAKWRDVAARMSQITKSIEALSDWINEGKKRQKYIQRIKRKGIEKRLIRYCSVVLFVVFFCILLEEPFYNRIVERLVLWMMLSSLGYVVFSFVNDAPKCTEKRKWTAFFLCLVLGVFGAHKFYEDKRNSGLFYIFSGGIFLAGWIIDCFILLFKPDPYFS